LARHRRYDMSEKGSPGAGEAEMSPRGGGVPVVAVCYYCGRNAETREIRVRTDPQIRRCCEQCWGRIFVLGSFDPAAGGGLVSSDEEEEHYGRED
jgi:hypothetical protein